jgi:hypothetical protein
MMSARLLVPLFAVFLVYPSACDPKSKSGGAPSASSPATSPPPAQSSDDQVAAIEVKPGAPPKYALAKLNQMELSALMSKNGWTPTVVGKTPGHGSESAIRVSAFKKDAEGNLESAVSVRCLEDGAPAPEHLAGEAYYADSSCEMKVEVRRGIRKKSAESKRLLEQLLASQPG